MFGIIILVNTRIQNQEDNLLQDSIETKAIVTDIIKFRRNHSVEIEYFVNGKSVSNRLSGNSSNLSVGDTILINYAKEDPKVFNVKQLNYMLIQETVQKALKNN